MSLHCHCTGIGRALDGLILPPLFLTNEDNNSDCSTPENDLLSPSSVAFKGDCALNGLTEYLPRLYRAGVDTMNHLVVFSYHMPCTFMSQTPSPLTLVSRFPLTYVGMYRQGQINDFDTKRYEAGLAPWSHSDAHKYGT